MEKDVTAEFMRNQVLEFVKKMKPRDHVVLFYTRTEDKNEVLFTYLKAGLERKEAAAYVASQQSPEESKRAMRKFGIDVDKYEQKGALKVMDYKDWYIIDGKFDPSRTLQMWKDLLADSKKRGFKGLRVTGEMACFFENNMTEELIQYERALHRTLDLPMTAICAYDQQTVAERGSADALKVMFDILKAHSTALVIGPSTVMMKTV
ncbi:MAG: MEDS domain-containing protein [Promethearchaeati archaeon SRVP18_Atabeyarchaeia-1]